MSLFPLFKSFLGFIILNIICAFETKGKTEISIGSVLPEVR